MMVGFFLTFSISAVICYAATRFSLNGRLYDEPGGRKKHTHPVPHVGGIAIASALFVTLLIYKLNWPLFIYGLGFLVLGAIDDLRKLSYWIKLLIQVLLAFLYVIPSDLTLTFFGTPLTNTLGKALTVIWIVAVVNGFNFIDGINGLAGSVGLVASIFLWVTTNSVWFLYLSGALVGFLLFNFKRGKVFLGDAGSYLLGFLITVSSLSISSFELAKATVFMGYPAYETTFVVFRRLFRGISPFHADRLHTHYTLEDSGFSPEKVVFLLAAYSAFCNLVSFLQSGWAFIFYLSLSLVLLFFVVSKSRS